LFAHFFASATTTESKEMTSLPTPPVHQFTSDTQMEQLFPDRKATANSRMPPDGHEFPVNRMSNGVTEKHTKRFGDSFLLLYVARETFYCVGKK
jgi:hypothetical protein